MGTPAAKLVIRDREGVLPISLIREYFERAMKDTEKFTAQPLEIEDGEQFAYANHDTNVLWNGFALGMRCAERIHQSALSNLNQQLQEEWTDATCRYCDNDQNLIGCDKCGSEYCKFHWDKFGGCCVTADKSEQGS